MDNNKILKIFNKEYMYTFLAMYLVFFVNIIHLFAIKTDYFGRISFVAIILIGTIIFSIDLYRRYEFIKIDYIYKFILINIIFFIYVLLNGIINGNIKRLIYGGYQYILYGLIFYAMYIFLKNINLKKFLNYIIIFNTMNALICIYEYVTKGNLIPTDYGQIAYEGVVIYRGRAFFGSFLNAGVVLGMSVFLALFFLIKYYKEKNIKLVFMYSFSVLIHVLGIFSTGSRGPLVSLFGGILFAFITYSIIISDKRKQNIVVLVIMIILGLLGLALILNIDASKIENSSISFAIHRIQTIFNWTTDKGNVMRIERWNFGLDLFKSNPLFGVGIATTGAKGLGTFSLGVTESGVIKKLAELGILGTLLFYIQFIYIGKISFENIVSKNIDFEKKIFVLLVFSALITLFIEEFIYQALEAEVVAFYLWMFVAIIFNVASYKKM